MRHLLLELSAAFLEPVCLLDILAIENDLATCGVGADIQCFLRLNVDHDVIGTEQDSEARENASRGRGSKTHIYLVLEDEATLQVLPPRVLIFFEFREGQQTPTSGRQP